MENARQKLNVAQKQMDDFREINEGGLKGTNATWFSGMSTICKFVHSRYTVRKRTSSSWY